MSDGLGSMTYVYDTWSRLTSETRYFTDLGASYQLRYEYNLSGALTKIYDPYNGTISYAINSSGQVTGVTGTHYAGVTTFTSGMQYLAWGGLKHESYFNNGNLNISYNGRLQMTRYGASTSDNQYFADGRVKFAGSSNGDTKFDRSYTYDQVGRLTQAFTGKDARGDNGEDGPYKQTYAYDVWDNMTSRNNRFWTQPDDLFTGTYANDRNSSWTYNASGQVTQDMLHHVYNSAGQQTTTNDLIGLMSIDQGYDGDGQQGVRVENRQSLTLPITTYYMRSSVLGGQIVTEIITTGFRSGTHNTHIYVNGTELALYDSWLNVIIGRLSNPVTGGGWQEVDPLGGLIGFGDPFAQNPNTTYDSMHPNEALYLEDGNPFDPGGGCTLDGLPVSCSYAAGRAAAGGVVRAPERQTVPEWVNGQLVWMFFQANADGYQGFLPMNAVRGNNGYWHYPRSDYGGRLSRVGFQNDGPMNTSPKPSDEKLVNHSDACSAMAFIATQLASAAIENNGGASAAAVEEFDHLFSQAYMSNDGIGKTLASAIHFYGLKPQPGLDASFWGQSGFRQIFKEKNDEGVFSDITDQTHHFAAFLSAGINDQKSAAFGHMLTDLNNKPDIELGAAGFYVGSAIGVDPAKLARIGSTIAYEICGRTPR